MGKNSSIEWTHHTFNPWWGCIKVSPACKFCYAETWAKRVGYQLWGADSDRRFFSDQHWREPLKWNAEALRDGERRRVFCASMADVFERRTELKQPRERLWELIEATPALDWLLLTKRPHNIRKYAPWQRWPRNVWLGATVETQKWARERIDHLIENDAAVHFLSCEPLLGALSLEQWFEHDAIDWVIAGGESGPRARPTWPSWVRNLRDQCAEFGVAFHFKQWGHWAPREVDDGLGRSERLFALGKSGAGRVLDGREWDGLPSVA